MSNAYWEWVKEQALLIKTDGCTGVIDFRKHCCYEHDLGYFYGRDPRHAFACRNTLISPDRDVEAWTLAAKISRSEADARFRQCNPIAKWRWIGVRLGGWNAWRKHRKERP